MSVTASIRAVLLPILITSLAAAPSQAQGPLIKIKKAIPKLAKIPPVLVPAAGPATGGAQPSAKVQETLMGPRVQIGRGPVAYQSEDGDHLAIVAAKGSRQVMMIDGVEGPVFDEIPLTSVWNAYPNTGAKIVFSPTGGRSAYVARRAGDFIAVVDGKEATTLSTPATQQAMAGTDAGGWTFLFNRDGSRLAYGAQDATTGGWVMIIDGVKGPAYRAIDFRQSVLNGKRLFYVARSPDQRWHAVVDGKPGPAYDEIKGLKVTADGAHYAYIGTTRSTNPVGIAMVAVIDGVASPSERDVSDLEQAPDGRVSYMAMRPQTTNAGGNPPHLIAGGLDITWTTTFGTPVPAGAAPQYHVAWSPDGKRFATVQQNTPNPGVTVLVNGKAMGPTYRSANQLMWSADGAHLAYLAVAESGTFMVIDGEESAGYNWIREFRWSPAGSRYAYTGGAPNANMIVIDGKAQSNAMGLSAGSITFSPDGKRLAYGSQTTGSGYQPVVDGVLKPQGLGNFATRVQGNLPVSIPQFLFSADGSHLAYVGYVAGKTAVWVDGVAQQGPMSSYFHPSWSPDGKHFAAVISKGSGVGWTIMVDGKLGPNFEDILVLNEASARFTTPTTYRYYTFKGTEIYRVTLDLN